MQMFISVCLCCFLVLQPGRRKLQTCCRQAKGETAYLSTLGFFLSFRCLSLATVFLRRRKMPLLAQARVRQHASALERKKQRGWGTAQGSSVNNDKFDYAEVAATTSSLSTPTNDDGESPFSRDSLGDTVIHLDKVRGFWLLRRQSGLVRFARWGVRSWGDRVAQLVRASGFEIQRPKVRTAVRSAKKNL